MDSHVCDGILSSSPCYRQSFTAMRRQTWTAQIISKSGFDRPGHIPQIVIDPSVIAVFSTKTAIQLVYSRTTVHKYTHTYTTMVLHTIYVV